MSSPATPAADLEHRDLDRLLRLLDDCGRATTRNGFREAVLDGLTRYFGYRNVTFFSGPSPAALFRDQDPLVSGVARRMVGAYVEKFHRLDPFAALAPRLITNRVPRAVTLNQISGSLSRPEYRHYLDSFLFRHGIHDKVTIPLVGEFVGAAGIGLLAEEPASFGARDLALAQLIGRHLSHQFRQHARGVPEEPSQSRLSPRQTEVVQLVAQGLTNEEIAARLFITVDTVKKHLTQTLKAMGCTNRTQVALAWRRLSDQSLIRKPSV